MAHGIAEVLELGRARGVQGTLRGFMLQAELCALVLNGCGSWPKEPTVYVEWKGQKVRGTNSSGCAELFWLVFDVTSKVQSTMLCRGKKRWRKQGRKVMGIVWHQGIRSKMQDCTIMLQAVRSCLGKCRRACAPPIDCCRGGKPLAVPRSVQNLEEGLPTMVGCSI